MADTTLEVLKTLADLIAQNQPKQSRKKDMFDGFTELQKKQAAYQIRLANADATDYMLVEIPKLYQKHIGAFLEVGVNGSVVKIPVDGRRHKIHKAFYPGIRKKLRHVDEKEFRASNTDYYTGDTGDIFEYQPR